MGLIYTNASATEDGLESKEHWALIEGISGSGNISNTVTLPVGSSITYTVTGTVAATATGAITNAATVTAPAPDQTQL